MNFLCMFVDKLWIKLLIRFASSYFFDSMMISASSILYLVLGEVLVLVNLCTKVIWLRTGRDICHNLVKWHLQNYDYASGQLSSCKMLSMVFRSKKTFKACKIALCCCLQRMNFNNEAFAHDTFLISHTLCWACAQHVTSE